MRQMILVGFLQAQNCSNFAGSWRHPDSRLDFTSPEFFAHIGRVLEAGKFQLAFFDDRLGMPEFHGGRFAEAVANGIRSVKMDPIACMMPIVAATERLGLGSTYSVTYYQPYHIARLFQTLDLMTKGRAAWNVVTSMNDIEAQNMGLTHAPPHDTRYDRADEFMEVVHGHWDSWADDALIVDRESGRFADPDKVRRLDHKGEHYASRGPFTVPRSAQGHPVVIQAGQSGRGKRFASQWGEVIFTSTTEVEDAAVSYAEIKAGAQAAGRNPDHVKVAALCHPVVAPTRAEAEDKFELIERLPLEVDSLLLLSEAINFDFGAKPIDEPFTDAELASMSGTQSARDHVVKVMGDKKPTPRDFINITRRGKLTQPWVGSPKEVADIFEEWFTKPAADGFVIGAPCVPGSYEDFVELVVPELQRRGLFHKDYEGPTLRENLGLPRPVSSPR
ncbi:MAG: FMN-dependent oxidoreductase (nitrilotriacetate monooxygenase family) [Gammaproteobacteria bacterium]|jgi:FMN-dependent oxidoreductase (nitrilotriacetate monooxygenase family)